VNNINVDETNRKISEYLKKNRQQIALGKIRSAASALEDKKSSNLIFEDGTSSTVEKQQVDVDESQQKSNNHQTVGGSQQVLSKFLYFASRNTENMSEEEKSQFLQTQKKAAGFDSTANIRRSYEEAFSTLYPTTLIN